MKSVVIKLKNPIYGGGVLTDREILHEKVFTEHIHGKDYQKTAKIWATTHVNNVAHIEGLDETSEKEISVSRKKKTDSGTE